MKNSKKVYRKFRGRLAQFAHWSKGVKGWEDRWSQRDVSETLESYSSGRLDEFERIFTRHLRKELPIIEAGCGVGQLVMALTARGYPVEGVDYVQSTIDEIRAACSTLNVRVGDIYNLDSFDRTYGGYISIGVLEHNPDGPLQGLREVRRVLHPSGMAFISVPYLNSARAKILKTLPEASDERLPDGKHFYQYYFSRDEFTSMLEQTELQVVEEFPYAVYSGLTRDHPVMAWIQQRGFFTWHIHRMFSNWCRKAPMWARWRWAHMLMFVCRRAET